MYGPIFSVTAYFLLGTALILRLISKGRILGDGLLFGLVLGTGVWIKGALLSFAVSLSSGHFGLSDRT